jgi:hypothetical protein
MSRYSKPMTPQEFVQDVSGIGLWLSVSILLVLAIAAALEALVTV